MTIKLIEPISWGSETISELVFQKPKAKHMRDLPASPTTGDILNLSGKLCGQPPMVIDELSITDMKVVLETVAGFLGSGPPTGPNA